MERPAVIAPSRPPGRTTSRCPWRQGLSTSWTTSWARAKAWTSTPPHLAWAQRGDSLPRLHTTTPPFHAQTPLPHRLDSTADETRDAADLSAGHAEEAEGDERTQSRRTVGELVQFVRDSTCPGFTPESICPSLAPTALVPTFKLCPPWTRAVSIPRRWAHCRTGCRSPA